MKFPLDMMLVKHLLLSYKYIHCRLPSPSHSCSVPAFSFLSFISLPRPTFFAQAHHSSRESSMAFFPIFLICSFVLFVAGAVPSNTTIGTFGPLVPFQPVDGWIYPLNQSVPIRLSLGNSSLALSPLPTCMDADG